ncbi:DUF305 domain-containing protein [Saccharopolyspora sp. MS10]|uniref:DUF305 domain-containing protein n=1 Tax=Saccharopolyspora sp. MS10 TaxID=3385973 RepID=UPI0039A1CBA4
MPVLWRAAGRRGAVVAGWCALAVLLVAGCGGGTTEPRPESAPVVLPGAPGDEPSVVPSVPGGRLSAAEPGRAEADYVRMMIVHHEQAVLMTDLAETRARDARVRSLAARIGGAQPVEIGAMRGWLDSRGVPPEEASEPGHHGGGHRADMPGMATPEQLAELAAVSGAEFDRLFLRLMTTHHEGAVAMATDVLAAGRDERVHEMAQDVLVTQSDEIATMRGLAADV